LGIYLRPVIMGCVLGFLTITCSTGGYWKAESVTPTPPPEIAFLLQPPPATGEPDPVELLDSEESQPTPVSPETTVESVTPTPEGSLVNSAPILYYTQAADTLPVVAVRFGVQPAEIISPDPLPETALLPPNQLLLIPHRLANTASSQRLLPDSEVVYSPSSTDFDVNAYVQQAGGYLSTYEEWLQSTKTTTGADIITRVAQENSINPRLLLALLEYHSHWVTGQPANLAEVDYPMGVIDLNEKGLYRQLVWAVNQLSVGYYAWREGRLIELQFSDGITARVAPDQNAGSVALEYYFSKMYDGERWLQAVDPQNGLPAVYERMFGSPWVRAQSVEPLYPPGLTQPGLILPFEMNRPWSFSGGPHGAWEHDGSYAALDFAPASSEPGCQESSAWATASASGLVVRSGNGVVVLDLDGDGKEQTGWVLLYLHVSHDKRAPIGTWVDVGDRLGHPSCEGGMATGTHVHIARKYNGEWMAADGPIPFNLSGWEAHAGDGAYKGTLSRDGTTIEACTCGSAQTVIQRTADDPAP
jgi:murein DD-endopeptidase MepM/ murein hydrolase activator NlpD